MTNLLDSGRRKGQNGFIDGFKLRIVSMIAYDIIAVFTLPDITDKEPFL